VSAVTVILDYIADALDWRFRKYEFSMWPDAARRLRVLAKGLS
jgi:hypothetical protein